MSFSDQEIEEFKTEAHELLEAAEKSLLEIGKGTDFKKCFDTVFRCFHNLKGGAGMMELNRLQSHTHELESILMQFKDLSEIPTEYVDLFLRGIDGARTILAEQPLKFDYSVSASPALAPSPLKAPALAPVPAPVQASASKLPPNEEFIAECEEIVERVINALQIIEKGEFSKDVVDALYRDVHSLKGAAFLFSHQTLGDLAHAVESSLEPVRDGTHQTSKVLVSALFKCMELADLEVSCIKANVENSQIKTLVVDIIRILAEATAALEPVVKENAPATIVATLEESPKQVEAEAASSIRVSVPLLDNLMTLMGEMVLVRNQVIQISNSSENLEFVNLSKRLNVVTSEIQGELMKTRMQPIRNILSKFNRVVRDLSQELGKQISLELHGADTELDKSLLEAIKDPLTHIVRNSCDHGIETPEIRRQGGKAVAGRITIKSYHEGGQVVIEVADDGKGLSRETLLRKGIEKGLLTEARAKLMSEKEVFNLIFAPGFSTAAKVTNVSGRGVGMDVVRTNIERIGGTVDLSSVESSGTSIRIKIPLTLAIVPALIVNSGKNIFAIPQVKLVELVRVDQMNENKIEYLHGAPMYRLRGNILPLVDLDKILGIKKQVGSEPSIVNIAVLNAEHCSFGLIVEEVQDTADIVVKPINRLLKSLQVYSGATVLGDGSIALILDVLGLSKVADLGKEQSADAERNKAEENKKRIASETQDYLLVRVNSPAKHAIVLGYVNRLEEFEASKVEFSGDQRVIRYGDVILPLIAASQLLGYPARSIATTGEKFPVVVIERAGRLFGIEVDEILDTLSTSIEMAPSFSERRSLLGNLNTKDELIVVVDPFEMILEAYPSLKPVMAQGAKVAMQATTARSGPSRVLLVEDTPFFRRAIANVLTSGGHEVVLANDGQQALDILNRGDSIFDLIVSDIEMPQLNGFDLARAVRANPKLAGLPMLAISSRADSSHVAKGVAAGFNVYLEKLQSEVLLKSVEEILRTSGRAA